VAAWWGSQWVTASTKSTTSTASTQSTGFPLAANYGALHSATFLCIAFRAVEVAPLMSTKDVPQGEKPKITIRKAERTDADLMLHLIKSLAEYEKLDPPDTAAQQRLVRDAFGDRPRFEVYLAEVDGEKAGIAAGAVGYAFVFEMYSSFLALPTLYLEDIFVLPEYRGLGAGIGLFRFVVAEAGRRGCGRVDFMALDWNKNARDFYHRLGAQHLSEWCYYRLSREQFEGIVTA
jgi:GNAT superfamily N-acetyltransferase